MILPTALVGSDDYQALPERVRKNLAGSIDYCMEAADKALSAEKLTRGSLLDLIDDIELDAFSILSSGTPETKVSPYRVHSSWTFECDRDEMSSIVVGDFKAFMSQSAAMFGRGEHDLQVWIKEWGAVTKNTLALFEGSGTYTEAVSRLIAIDALMANFLVFAASVRLSNRISFN